jgi:hypothetical protein
VSSLRAVVTNLIESGTLKNGTGGGAPALSEVSPYLTSNTQKRSRRSVWQAAGTGTLNVDFDLGSDQNFTVAGIGAHSGISGVGIASFDVQYAAAAAGYVPGVWLSAASGITVSSARDKLTTFAQKTGRYIRFVLTVTTVFTLGKFVIGAFDYDLGFLFSSLEATPRSPNFEDGAITEDPVVNYTGNDYETWALSWEAIPNASMAKIEALRAARRSFWIADKSDVFREFIVSGSQLARTHQFEQASDTIYNVSAELRQLG